MDMNAFMKNPKALQERMEQMKREMDQREYEGIAGGGLVKLAINGACDLKKLVIDPSLLTPDEAGTISDLVIAAFNSAKTKWGEDSASKMSGMMDMMGALKNFKPPF